jgi:hypothetical protein
MKGIREVFVTLSAQLMLIGTVAATVILPHAARAADAERINSFASEIIVHTDGTISIHERIEYAFTEPRHGIIRDIPTRYVSDDGRQYEIPIAVAGVVGADGSPVRYVTERQPNGERITVGDPDRKVSGLQTYVISYTAYGALRYFDDHDEVYWNVTGNGWEVPIERVSATIRLPDATEPAAIRLKCFTGPEGSTDQNCLGNTQGKVASFVADRGPLTVVAGWQPGVVERLVPVDRKPMSGGVYSYLVAPLVLLGGLFASWRTKGRISPGRTSSGSGFSSGGRSGGGAGGGGGRSW